MTRSYRRASIASAALLALTSGALAQSPDPRRAAETADTVLRCERPHSAELARYTRMLEETRASLTSERTSDAARRDAARAVEVLTERIRTEARAIAECAAPETASTLAAPASTPPSVEPISEHVVASTPERTRGAGTLAPDAVLRAVRRLGPALDACYDSYAGRYAIERGGGALVFWTSPTGAVSEARIENLTIGDTTFRSCVAQSIRALGTPGPASGGSVEMRVPLRFGPEE